jgi:inhibitor of cysteine peptidase
MSDFNLTDKDNNSTAKAAAGDTITVILPANPSTGYLWQAKDTTAGHLDSVLHDAAGVSPGTIGSPIQVSFNFTVQQSGHFTLYYGRPWNPKDPPSKWFDVTVEVTGP